MTNKGCKNISKFFKGLWVRNLLVLCVLLSVVNPAVSQQKPAPSYQVKAAFLFNFTRFIEWPEESFKSVNAPFVIGVIGNMPMANYLEELIEGEKFGSHPIIIRRYQYFNEVYDCHILFVSSRDASKIKNALPSLHHRNILTVSDSDNFLRSGGIVRFYTEENKIRIQINIKSAQSTQLSISSKLLNIASIFNK